MTAASECGEVGGPFAASGATWVRAGGALAVFVIVFFYNPASLVVSTPSPSSAHSARLSSSEPRPFSSEPRPSLTLAPEVTDETGRPINRREAPFKIRVKGTATGVDRSYVYLVVDDSNAQWIEPTAGLGPNVGGEFSGYCYLGEIGARDSIGKLYRIFAVATNREYTEHEKLDRRTIQAESSIIELLRVK